MIKRTLLVLTLPLFGLTACDTSSKPPFDCHGVIPEAVPFEVADEWYWDEAFMAWVDRNGAVQYEKNFWYSYPEGTTIGWSAGEDGEICISPWSR